MLGKEKLVRRKKGCEVQVINFMLEVFFPLVPGAEFGNLPVRGDDSVGVKTEHQGGSVLGIREAGIYVDELRDCLPVSFLEALKEENDV